MTQTLADRVWHALHALPRRPNGRPPSYRSLEKAYGVPVATFSKLINGDKKRVRSDTLMALGAALGVSAEWLITGDGEAPALTGVLPQRYTSITAEPPLDPSAQGAGQEGGVREPTK